MVTIKHNKVWRCPINKYSFNDKPQHIAGWETRVMMFLMLLYILYIIERIINKQLFINTTNNCVHINSHNVVIRHILHTVADPGGCASPPPFQTFFLQICS